MQGSGLANVHSEARETRGGGKGSTAQANAGRSLSRTTSPTPNGGSDLGGASATHGGSLRWGFLHPDGAVASPRVGRGGGGFSAQWFNNDPNLPGGVRSSKIGSHMGMSGLQPVLGDYNGVSGNVDQSGAIMPMELPRYAPCLLQHLQSSQTKAALHAVSKLVLVDLPSDAVLLDAFWPCKRK